MALSVLQVFQPNGIELLSGASSLATVQHGETTILLALFPGSQSLISFRYLADGSVVQIDDYTVFGSPIAGADRAIVSLDNTTILVTGFDTSNAQLLEIGNTGTIFENTDSKWVGDLLEAQRKVQTLDGDEGKFVFSISNTGRSVQVYEVSIDGELNQHDVFEITSDSPDTIHQAVSDLSVIEHLGEVWLIASLEGVSSVVSMRLNADGSLTQVSEVGALSGIGLNAPQSVVPVTFDDKAFVVVSSSLSFSLSVFELTNEGALEIVN